jgi:hypothetical protein
MNSLTYLLMENNHQPDLDQMLQEWAECMNTHGPIEKTPLRVAEDDERYVASFLDLLCHRKLTGITVRFDNGQTRTFSKLNDGGAQTFLQVNVSKILMTFLEGFAASPSIHKQSTDGTDGKPE